MLAPSNDCYCLILQPLTINYYVQYITTGFTAGIGSY
jgi:hypothetical protein